MHYADLLWWSHQIYYKETPPIQAYGGGGGGGGDNVWINSFIILLSNTSIRPTHRFSGEKACLFCCFRTFDIGVL